MYFVSGIKDVVTGVGGEFADTKERPVVAILRSSTNDNIYWAIPVGNVEHRKKEQLDRINRFMSRPKNDISSCYYHIGNTNKKSIFFISDVFPITSKYVLREYLTFNSQHYLIKNKQLLSELEGKLKRILAFEQSKIKQTGKFYFRQNIFGVYDFLKNELKNKESEE